MMLRRNILAVAAVLLIPAVMSAQNRSLSPEDVLVFMQEALHGLGTADFSFDFHAEDQAGDILGDESGHFVAQDESFRLSTDAMTMFCDGRTKWIYDMVNDEITIFPHDVTSVDPAENPFAVLSKADPASYTFKGRVRTGDDSYTVVMVPKSGNVSFTQLEIAVSADTFLPVSLKYMNSNGDMYVLSIRGVSSTETLPKDYFKPSEELLDNPDIYITDMR